MWFQVSLYSLFNVTSKDKTIFTVYFRNCLFSHLIFLLCLLIYIFTRQTGLEYTKKINPKKNVLILCLYCLSVVFSCSSYFDPCSMILNRILQSKWSPHLCCIIITSITFKGICISSLRLVLFLTLMNGAGALSTVNIAKTWLNCELTI